MINKETLPSQAGQVEPATILVVDDDPVILGSVCDVLRVSGYQVLSAVNGVDALQVIEDRIPDLILADISMPEMDGYAFYQALQEVEDRRLIPFAFITAKGQPHEIREGMRLGVDDYLPKPFEVEDVLDVVETRLRRVRGIQHATQRQLQGLNKRILDVLNQELQTPLALVTDYANRLVLTRDCEIDQHEFDEFLSDLTRDSRLLVEALEDLSLVARIEAGQAARIFEQRKCRVDMLDLLVDGLVAMFEEKAAAAEVSLQTVVPPNLPPLEVDVEYLNDALGRLIDNAISSSQPGDVVEISVSTQDEAVAIAITDHGRGIPLEELPFIFELFHQVDRERYENQGIGVGLSIAKGLVEMHGGAIQVESEPNRESTFTVSLPLMETGI